MNIVNPYDSKIIDIPTNREGEEGRRAIVEEQFDGDMAKDLMKLVGQAIDKWASHYGMEKLPKKIIFKQALGIMNAWEGIIGN